MKSSGALKSINDYKITQKSLKSLTPMKVMS